MIELATLDVFWRELLSVHQVCVFVHTYSSVIGLRQVYMWMCMFVSVSERAA